MTVSPSGAASAGSIGRRAGAFAIDAAIACLVAAVLIGVAGGATFALAGALQPGDLAAVMLFTWSGLVVLLLGWGLVHCGMQGGHGSFGQRLLGLRLVDADSGDPIGFWRAVWRNIVFGLAGSIVVGWFTPLFDASGRRQGWHDLASGAMAVDARTARPDASRLPRTGPAAAAFPSPARPAPAMPLRAAGAPSSEPGPTTPAPAWPDATAGRAAPASSATANLPTGPVADLSWLFRSEHPEPASPPAPPARAPRAEADPFPSVTTPFPAATTTEPLGNAGGPRTLTAARAATLAWAPEDDVDVTRTAVPPPAQRAALFADAPVIAVLTWDDGTRMAVYGRTLYGRNPATEQGAVAIAVRDETLSLSKTHFEVGGDAGGAWVADRHSTNGTTLVRDGGRIPLLPGLPTPLRPGDSLEVGDRRVTVGAGR